MVEVGFKDIENDKVNVVYDKVKLMDILESSIEHESELENIDNKYVKLKCELGLKHWRLVSVEQLISKKIYQMLGPVYREFLNSNPRTVFMFNYLGKKLIAVIIRSLSEKSFMDISINSNVFYGINEIPDDFTYGNPIIVVEGLYDKEVMSEYMRVLGYNIPVVSMLRSSITNKKAELITKITDKFILNPDNDKAGENNLDNTIKCLINNSSNGVKLCVLRTPSAVPGYGIVKDIGDCYPINEFVVKNIKKQFDEMCFNTHEK